MLGDDIVLRTKLAYYMKKVPEFTFKVLYEPACLYRRHSFNISKNEVRQIKLMAQYLDRYFPNRSIPDFFVSCFARNIDYLSLDDYIEINNISNGILKNEENLYKITQELVKIQNSQIEKERENKRNYKHRFNISLVFFIIIILCMILIWNL